MRHRLHITKEEIHWFIIPENSESVAAKLTGNPSPMDYTILQCPWEFLIFVPIVIAAYVAYKLCTFIYNKLI